MKYLQSISKVFFWLLIFALLAAPLGLIYEISNREMEQYKVPETPMFHETAYGGIARAERMDIYDYVTVSGIFASEAYAYMELTQDDPSMIRWNIEIGNEVSLGQVVGTYLGEDVISTVEGIVTGISAYGDTYLKVRQFTPVVLETSVEQRVANTLKRAENLTTEDGVAVSVVYISRVPDADGTVRIKLSFDSDDYTLGQILNDIKLFTGGIYLQALVLPEACLYQKVAGENEQWYARQVSPDGFFIGEVPVTRGYSNGEYCCVAGVTEGAFFDTGYGALTGTGE